MDYSAYQDLKVRRLEPGIVEIVMGEEGKLAVATARAHGEMARIWLDIDRDPEVRIAILRGAGMARGAGSGLQHAQLLEDHHLRDPRPGGGRRAGRGTDGRHLDRGEERKADRRPYAPGRRGGRPCRDHLAAALRHGEGEVLPAYLRHGERRGGGAHRTGFADLRREPVERKGAGGGAQARRRPADRAALDQIFAQQLAAPGGAVVRRLARARDDGLYRPRGEGRPCRAARE